MVFINEKQQAKLKEVNSTIPVKDPACVHFVKIACPTLEKMHELKEKFESYLSHAYTSVKRRCLRVTVGQSKMD